jgi:hypothetical protein
MRRTSPIVIELAYQFRCSDRKGKYVQYEPTENLKIKEMPSTTVRGQHQTVGAILDTPQ